MRILPWAGYPQRMAEVLPLLRTPPLQKGDTIGVVASSYSPRARWLARGVRALERAGYSVLLDPELSTTRRYQRAEDERRAANFTAMWTDARVKALISGTGGYGAVRMLPYLDPDLFRAHPKSFVGYSDVVVLETCLVLTSIAMRTDMTMAHHLHMVIPPYESRWAAPRSSSRRTDPRSTCRGIRRDECQESAIATGVMGLGPLPGQVVADHLGRVLEGPRRVGSAPD